MKEKWKKRRVEDGHRVRLVTLGMVMGVLLALVSPLPVPGAWAQIPGDGGPSQESVGVLEFIPRPEISLCFCGSFYLHADKGYASYYLASTVVDLSKYIGDKIIVIGTPFSMGCTGTLWDLCDYLRVIEVEAAAPTPVGAGTWGRIKALFADR